MAERFRFHWLKKLPQPSFCQILTKHLLKSVIAHKRKKDKFWKILTISRVQAKNV